jgi:hypothetical protein
MAYRKGDQAVEAPAPSAEVGAAGTLAEGAGPERRAES